MKVFSSVQIMTVGHKITLVLAGRFCLVALYSSCCWFLYGFSIKSHFTIFPRDLSKISSCLTIFHISLHGFLFALFLTPSVTFLIRTERLYSETGFTEAVCSWNLFHKHWTISSPRNTLYQLFSKRQIYHILLESAIFNQTIK